VKADDHVTEVLERAARVLAKSDKLRDRLRNAKRARAAAPVGSAELRARSEELRRASAQTRERISQQLNRLELLRRRLRE
jgi:hypothetical protein